MRDPGPAAVLSVILLGAGQLYNGRILWLIITPGLWIGAGGLLGWGLLPGLGIAGQDDAGPQVGRRGGHQDR